MSGLESTMAIANRVAQRRIGLVLLPLRLWLGVAWLRSGVAKALDPGWFDGSALSGFLHGQLADGAPLAFYGNVMTGLWESIATPLGVVVLVGEIAIGLGLLTGTLTNLALLAGIVLNVNFVLAGDPSPSQLFIVAQLVLLTGGAGASFSVDRWLSLHVRGPLLTGERGLLDGTGLSPGARIVLTIVAVGTAAAVVPQIGDWLPERGSDDSAFALFALALIGAVALSAVGSTRRSAGDQAPEHRLPPPVPEPRAAVVPPAFARPAPPVGAPTAARRPVGPPRHQPPPAWPVPAPVQSAARTASRIRADAPTTQFRRPTRVAQRAVAYDPYAELRRLPPPDLSA